jgi:thiamine-monophosphate kinase
LPLSEAKLIEHIRRASRTLGRQAGRAVAVGIGDDAAVLRVARGNELLVTTDFSIEGTHFRREWHSARSVGHRCLTRGLSDIAAMGGEPRAAFLSLALPAELPQDWVDEFLDGLLKLARRFKVTLAGGDIAEAPMIAADIVVTGEVPAGKALLRSGTKPGDPLYVTGELGTSAAVLQAFRSGQKVSPDDAQARAHFFPEPRIEAGVYLRKRKMASAAIDISDGLSTDLAHLCEESGVGAVLHEHSIPRTRWSQDGYRSSALHFALHGGDDYELLFTARPEAKIPARIGKVPVRRIGEIIADRDRRIFLMDSHGQRKPITPGGWQHFS